jgi:outer membrane autotransporter protein
MTLQMRSKAGLLSRVSTLALLAAAGTLGATQQAQAACDTTLNSGAVTGDFTVGSPFTCVNVNGAVTGDVINNNSVGDPGTGFVPFSVTEDIGDQLINNGNISGGFFDGKTQRGALTIWGNATVSGGIFNNGLITSTSGNGIQIGTGGENAGYVEGGIWNYNSISSGTRYGVAAIEGTLTGGLHNQTGATLNGGLAAIYVDDSFTSWSGGIQNSGTISGVNGAIVMGDGGGEGSTLFSDGITNHGGARISSVGGTAIIVNSDIASFDGGITNYGVIEGANDGIAMFAEAYSGDLINGNLIRGGDTAVQFYVGSFQGNVTNTGEIDGGEGRGLVIESYGTIQGTGGGGATAAIRNTGNINADGTAVTVFGDTVVASFTNDSIDPLNVPPGTINSVSGIGVILAAQDTWTGNVTNTGSITGATIGMVVGATNSEGLNTVTDTFNGTITNSGVIAGSATGVLVTAETFNGNITNSGGSITGDIGLRVAGDVFFGSKGPTGSFNGTIANSGDIIGDFTGASIAVASFEGNVTNEGSIGGGTYGLVISANEFTGNVTNDGTITGGLIGLHILGAPTSGCSDCDYGVGTFAGNITNNGYIGGADGLVVNVGSITGDITNNGDIVASTPVTGLHVIADGMTGNIVNNDYIGAPSNALHVDIDNLDGTITNTGTLESYDYGSVAARLEVGNGATFVNGGLILGDVLFGGKAAYDFVGEDGGIEGRLLGQVPYMGNDDVVTVRDGTHYFFFEGKGAAVQNFASFNVEDGGTAIMGARYIGDPNGSGVTFSNVDALNVTDGTLYIDKSTILQVDDSYTQGEDGRIMFYLAPPSEPEESAFSVAAAGSPIPGVDYGQVIVDGNVTLNGTIAAYLDPSFATSSLDEVEYADVIVANGGTIIGDFTATELLANSSIYSLLHEIDANTVDLFVTRTSLAHIGGLSNIVVETIGPWKSMVNDRSLGTQGCSLGGGGWCLNRYAANEPGATTVMTDASPGEDPFAWLRTGTRRVGETAVWGRGVGVWGETDGNAIVAGTDFDLYGGIVGVDHVFSPVLLAGLAAQWTTSNIEFDGLPDTADIDSMEVGAYVSWGDTRLYLNANVSYIWHDFDVTRFVAATQAFGDYDGSTISAYAEAGKTFETDGGFRIQPLIALSFAHLETDAYSETGSALTLLNVFDSDFDSLKSLIGARFSYPFDAGHGRRVVPEARIVWSHEFMDDQSSFLATVQGGPPVVQLIQGQEYSRDSLILGTGLTAPLSDATLFFVDYDAALSADVTTHTVSAGFRHRW